MLFSDWIEEEAEIVGTAQSTESHGAHHSRLDDGKGLDGRFDSDGCASTNNTDPIQWFALELEAPHFVTKVQIARRTEATADTDLQGRNVRITVGPSSEYDASEPLCRPEIPNLEYTAGLIDYPCTEGAKEGKYVKITSTTANEHFVICEVKVFVRAAADACEIEENITLPGYDINDGDTDPRQNDAESCRSFCKANYPSAAYFTWVGPSFQHQTWRKKCWCKTSNADREAATGVSSGKIC